VSTPTRELPPTAADAFDDPELPEEEAAAEPRRTRWWDLLVVAALGGLGMIAPELPLGLRALLGAVAVLIVPGYAAVAALFPGDELDGVERLGLSLSTSLAFTALLALLLDVVPGGFTFPTIRLAVTGCGLVLLAVAVVRRHRAARGLPTRARQDDEATRVPMSRATRFTQAIVVANVAVAALAYALTIGSTPASSTAFYVLGPDKNLGGYPREVARDEPFVISLGVQQADDRPGSYRVVARSGEAVLTTVGPVSVGAGAVWQSDVRLALGRVGADQEVALALEREGDAEPYRLLRLWIDVKERA
jgi:uncharacterized membrane protein